MKHVTATVIKTKKKVWQNTWQINNCYYICITFYNKYLNTDLLNQKVEDKRNVKKVLKGLDWLKMMSYLCRTLLKEEREIK